MAGMGTLYSLVWLLAAMAQTRNVFIEPGVSLSTTVSFRSVNIATFVQVPSAFCRSTITAHTLPVMSRFRRIFVVTSFAMDTMLAVPTGAGLHRISGAIGQGEQIHAHDIFRGDNGATAAVAGGLGGDKLGRLEFQRGAEGHQRDEDGQSFEVGPYAQKKRAQFGVTHSGIIPKEMLLFHFV